MGLKADLERDVAAIFKSTWSERDGTVVPNDESLKLANDAITIKATVLYADLADSTNLVDGYSAHFAAEIYKTFLICAAKVIRSEGGVITAYDGDRIMAVFIGESPNTRAVRSALKIHYAAGNIVAPAMKNQYPNETYQIKHVVGVDKSDLYVARTGVRGANDLVWVGRAANYAAKLSTLPDSHRTYITKEVHDVISDSLKTSDDGSGRAVWEAVRWTEFDGRIIYRSNFWETIS
jgi:class 3 adenylate cyclase